MWSQSIYLKNTGYCYYSINDIPFCLAQTGNIKTCLQVKFTINLKKNSSAYFATAILRLKNIG